MTESQRQLYQKICDLEITAVTSTLSFESRLARENGWDLAQAVRVNDEYRKFLFLLIHAGHPVTPSDQVDQAWHLHLLYTRSYWDDLCGRLINRPLHHGPTAGGNSENEKFVDWYEQTKLSYRRFFAQDPPLDIWPSSSKRFGEDTQFRRINMLRCWVLPNPLYRLRWWMRRLKFLGQRYRLSATKFFTASKPMIDCKFKYGRRPSTRN